jgi:succinoglycan biosynthesis transport protein ExoP
MSMPHSDDPRPLPPGATFTNRARIPVQKTITIDIPHTFPNSQQQDPRSGDSDSPLHDYLWRIGRHKGKIIAFVVVVTIAAGYLSSLLTPIYQSQAMIEVDRSGLAGGAPGIIGHDSQATVASETDQFLYTQMKLIRSDSVLRPVVEQYDPESRPGLRSQFRAHPSGPVELANLAVTQVPSTNLIQITYRHPDPQMAARVANAVAQSYIEQMYGNRYRSAADLSTFMAKQLGELRVRMEQSAAALAEFEREFQVINPEERTSIISARLLQLNTEYTAAQADRVRKETAYNSLKSGAPDAAFVSSQGDEMKKLQGRLNEAQEKFSQLKTQVGVNHPDYREAASLITELTKQIDALGKSSTRRAEAEYQQSLARELMIQTVLTDTKDEFDRLNAGSYKYHSLKEDAENDKKLYDELMLKIQESSINSGFQGSWIRLVDRALPSPWPVHRSMPLSLAVAFLFSTSLAIGVVLVSSSLDRSVHDPAHVTRMGSRVLGSLPLVRSWRVRGDVPLIAIAQNANGGGMLARTRSRSRNLDDARSLAFDEAVRWIRESILLGGPNGPIRTLLVTSASPKEGKSTFAARLAIANGMQNIKTLLVDADLRHPSAHIGLGLENNAGLSDVIRAKRDWREMLQQVPWVPCLDFLAAGEPTHRVFDLLGPGLEQVLNSAYREYGLIVIDSAPALQFAEPLKAASLADGVVVLARANYTDRKVLQAVLTALEGVNARVSGVVLNQVDEQNGKKYYYYPSGLARG